MAISLCLLLVMNSSFQGTGARYDSETKAAWWQEAASLMVETVEPLESANQRVLTNSLVSLKVNFYVGPF